jgi:hypothetical protein
VEEVFAGFVCGYALALLSTPLLAILLLRLRARSVFIGRMLPENSSVIGVGVLLHSGLFLFWTAIGLVLGLVLFVMRDGDGGLGSPNAAYSLVVAGLAIALSAPIILVLPRLRQAALTAAVLFALLFGWLMPHMSTWTSFESTDVEPPPERPGIAHA